MMQNIQGRVRSSLAYISYPALILLTSQLDPRFQSIISAISSVGIGLHLIRTSKIRTAVQSRSCYQILLESLKVTHGFFVLVLGINQIAIAIWQLIQPKQDPVTPAQQTIENLLTCSEERQLWKEVRQLWNETQMDNPYLNGISIRCCQNNEEPGLTLINCQENTGNMFDKLIGIKLELSSRRIEFCDYFSKNEYFEIISKLSYDAIQKARQIAGTCLRENNWTMLSENLQRAAPIGNFHSYVDYQHFLSSLKWSLEKGKTFDLYPRSCKCPLI